MTNIMTVITPDWIEPYLDRWVRKVKASNPNADLYLIVDGVAGEHDCLSAFKEIKEYPKSEGREWWNEIRLYGCKIFGVKEIIYCDADADIVGDISDINREIGKGKRVLGCVKSPSCSKEWLAISKQIYGREINDTVNNGFLFMRGVFNKEYAESVQKLETYDPSARIKGTYAFNMFFLNYPKLCKNVDYSYGTTWWDFAKLKKAKVIQYCNDQGQTKLRNLETLYKASRAT